MRRTRAISEPRGSACAGRAQFFGDDRLPIMRRMILASTPEEEAAALEELRAAQKADFLGILEAMDACP